MTMSPGVMSIFSSISSRSRASTRNGWSSMRRPVRVVATTVTSSSIISSGCRSMRTTRSVPGHDHGYGDRHESLVRHRDPDRLGGGGRVRDPGGVGHLVGRPAGCRHDHRGSLDRVAGGPHLDPDAGGLLSAGRGRQLHREDEGEAPGHAGRLTPVDRVASAVPEPSTLPARRRPRPAGPMRRARDPALMRHVSSTLFPSVPFTVWSRRPSMCGGREVGCRRTGPNDAL